MKETIVPIEVNFDNMGPAIAIRLVMLLVVVIIVIIIYRKLFAPYRDKLFYKYGFKLIGFPANLAIFCYFITHAVQNFGFHTPLYSEVLSEVLMWTALIGAPGIILATLWCLIKTKHIGYTLINIPLLYIYCVTAGYLFIGYVMVLVLLNVAGGMFGGLLTSGTGGKKYTVVRYKHSEDEDLAP